ncbi:acid phosphatase pho5 [Sporothrix bragantina]|uniref:3-phytase n=1 Tax=Sporothrix bragantina TaxID=671064 RepID=A0ABP0BRY3_9PEZI
MSSTSLLAAGLALISSVSALRSYPQFGEKQFSQSFLDGYNLLKFTSSLGPYSNRVSYGIDRNTPAGCEVDQVFLLMRHGERYPDYSGFGQNYEAVLAKMAASNVTSWKGDLTFLNDWTYYVEDPGMYSQESYSGAYAGLADAYARGTDYRLRYGHLWDKKSIVPIFAAGYSRVVETARYFGQGFLGYNYSTNAAVNIISESSTGGANSLTPTCAADSNYLPCLLGSFSKTMPELEVAAARFNAQNPGLNLTAIDVTHLMQMAAFELNVRSYTPWAEAFTLDEWVSYGYIWDLMYYNCVGPGSEYQIAVGQVYTNATRVLMQQGPKSGSMFWSFVHDTNITPVVAALGLDVPDKPLPNDTIHFPYQYRASDIVPMGGHLTIERMTCNATAKSVEGVYVRAVINEAVVPFNTCQGGPGFSCPLANYSAIVDAAPRFNERCNTSSTYPQYLDFFWNYNTTTQYNYLAGPIGYQQTYTDA